MNPFDQNSLSLILLHIGGFPMPHYLLTGAGFSRNWGGWLADEAFEYLLGAPEIDDYLRNILWTAKLRGEGFEGALSMVQGEYSTNKTAETASHLDKFSRALVGMFNAMQTAFNKLDRHKFEPFSNFLSQFDAIFTLNQDTLLETVYAGDVRWSERWYGSYLPYMNFVEPTEPYPFMLRESMMHDAQVGLRENYQPIYKLHGSYNWFAEPHGERLLVMGGNKAGSISSFPILKQYQDEFGPMLSQPDSHLMVIGYGFGDNHINDAIRTGAAHGLKLFIVDVLGVDVVDKRNRRAAIAEPVTDLMQQLIPGIIGASRRPLPEIINSDPVEQQKVMRFFDSQPTLVRVAPQPGRQQ